MTIEIKGKVTYYKGHPVYKHIDAEDATIILTIEEYDAETYSKVSVRSITTKEGEQIF